MEIVKYILFTFNVFMGLLFADFGVSYSKKKGVGCTIGVFMIMFLFIANIVYIAVS